MPSWQGQSKGNKLGYSIFISLLKWGGVIPAYFLLRFVAGWYFLFSASSSKHILDFFKRLGFSKWKSYRLLYKNYYCFGQSLIDKIVLMSGLPNRFTFNFDGEEYLHQAVAGKKGGLLLSAHMGNWEIAGHLLKRLHTTINIVMFDGEHRQIKEYLDKITGEKNAKIILIKNDLSHIYEISEALNNNELVCMHADRFIEGNKTIRKKFMEEEALFPAGPFLLAATFDVPVSFVFAFKETTHHYHFFASPLKTYKKQAREETMNQMVDDFAAEMEKKINIYPAQWYNYYNFWQK
jgi:predicted LPLAT superfamily acyltransferase